MQAKAGSRMSSVMSPPEGVERSARLDGYLGAIVEELGWEVGALWTPVEDDAYLECSAFWATPELANGDFALASRQIRFEKGLGLVGRVWQEGVQAWLEDVRKLETYVRIGPARREKIRTACVTPLHDDGTIVGVLEFYSRRSRLPDRALLRSVREMSDLMIARLHSPD